ncbi:hypothetical protein ANN_09612 [Periplaneta americana]|uniref:Uncharacterized protein n=1 Tax=Periplaneta americana TaxID=6978 RepID=A0ABQ8TPD9_PERAM|nr:hypothetical protein ANN_09612 [Periplaneta americana]
MDDDDDDDDGKGDNASEMSPGSSTESYPAFARIGLRKNPGKNLNQVTCPNRDSNPGHLVSRPDALTVTPQVHQEVHCLAKDGSSRRVDIIAIDRRNDRAIIIDPTVRFETAVEQPVAVHEEKKTIYDPTIQYFSPHLGSNGQRVWPRNQVARVRIPVGASYLVEVFSGNLVVPPLVAITAAILSGMLSTSLHRISTGMRPLVCIGYPLLQHGTQLDNGSWPHLPRPQSPVQFGPKVLNGIEIRTLCRPVQPVNIIVCIPLHSSRRNMRPTSIVQLSAMLQEEWRRIPVDILHKLVESMPDRVAFTATRGGTTRFPRGKNSAQLLFGR